MTYRRASSVPRTTRPDVGTADPADTTLVRAVGLNEARDIEQTDAIRLHPFAGYETGKWFATTIGDAVRWGRAFQRFPGATAFRIVTVTLPTDLVQAFEFHERWDGIGPAYFVSTDLLPALNAVASVQLTDGVFDPKGHR